MILVLSNFLKYSFLLSKMKMCYRNILYFIVKNVEIRSSSTSGIQNYALKMANQILKILLLYLAQFGLNS